MKFVTVRISSDHHIFSVYLYLNIDREIAVNVRFISQQNIAGMR